MLSAEYRLRSFRDEVVDIEVGGTARTYEPGEYGIPLGGDPAARMKVWRKNSVYGPRQELLFEGLVGEIGDSSEAKAWRERAEKIEIDGVWVGPGDEVVEKASGETYEIVSIDKHIPLKPSLGSDLSSRITVRRGDARQTVLFATQLLPAGA